MVKITIDCHEREGTHSPNLLGGLIVLFGLDLSSVFVTGSLPVRPTGASLPRAWTVLLLGPFFLVPLPVISARAVPPVASFRDTFFDVFSLVKILSSRSSALHFGLSFSSCCGIQLYKGVPRYGFNLSTCTTLGLDRGAFWIRYTTLDKDAITKKGCLTEDSFLFCGECYVAIHYHPVVMASTRAFYHSFASVPS